MPGQVCQLCVGVLILLALMTCSCCPASQSPVSNLATPQPNLTSNPVLPEPEAKPTRTLPKPYLSSEISVVAVELNETNKRLLYDLAITYPQIDKPRTANQRKFNRFVRNLVYTDIRQFKNYCTKTRRYANGKKRNMDYRLGMNYEVFYATKEILSINLTMDSFTGYLNSDWYPIPLNYDLKGGKPLSLAHLFKRRSKYLGSIAAYCVEHFKEHGLNCGGTGIGSEQWMREGTKPQANNYSSWNVARNGLQINFGEYQVGPGCLGLVSVLVPYDYLRGNLRRDVEWVKRLGTERTQPNQNQAALER